jgi:hypothetical protein
MRLSKRPVLVTGSHRSGTTWVGRMISQSPAIGEIWEPLNIYSRPGVCAGDFRVWYPYINQNNGHLYEKAIKDCLLFKYNYCAEIRTIQSLKDIARMVKDSTRFAILKSQNKRPLQKDPMALFSVEWLAHTFDMQVIVLIRHPAAFAGSLKKLNWQFPFSHLLSQTELIADHLQDFEADIIQYANQKHPLIAQANLLWNLIYSVAISLREKYPDWLFLRHEDLSRDPIDEFKAIYEFLGLDFTPKIKDEIRAYTDTYNPDEKHRLRSIHRHSAENIRNWEKQLTPEEIAQTRKATAKIAAHFYKDEDW